MPRAVLAFQLFARTKVRQASLELGRSWKQTFALLQRSAQPLALIIWAPHYRLLTFTYRTIGRRAPLWLELLANMAALWARVLPNCSHLGSPSGQKGWQKSQPSQTGSRRHVWDLSGTALSSSSACLSLFQL